MTAPAAPQAELALRAHNPDVLTCIANLSNDEVFTPPALANQMLDTIELAWAESNEGKSIWADATITFLDPFTKSGVFLREIVGRLTVGLADEIPDLQERVDHILTAQVFGIGITTLTSLLARRSVYCSKLANGPHSIAKTFDRDWGNIWFERTEHVWTGGSTKYWVDPVTGDETEVIGGGRCRFCGAPRQLFDRTAELETHAYAFIHADDVRARVAEMFGAEMQFDVIVGNPPYQMTGGAGGTSDSSIYHLFVEQAMRLEPRYLNMVIPARWMAGGRGMSEFRTRMFAEHHLQMLVDYPVATDIFPSGSADFEGGACYFLWSRDYDGPCSVLSVRGDTTTEGVRALDEFDVFVREEQSVDILRKVLAKREPSITTVLSRDTPFGIATNFSEFRSTQVQGDVSLYRTRLGKRDVGFVARDAVSKSTEFIDSWKVLVPEAYGERGAFPANVLGSSWVAPPPSACTQSFLFFSVESEQEASSLESYYRTKFFRFMVSLRKITQHALHSTYTWVPIQTWDRTWLDSDLFEKYGLTDEEVEFLESRVRPMESGHVVEQD
jgi:site-specific DNA-methyltransferase (adenine-specific)